MTSVNVPAIPVPMRWLNEPADWRVSDDTLTIEAGARTDLFADPGGPERFANAAALIGAVEGDHMLSARVSFGTMSTYDAAALVLYAGEASWAKFAIEISPQSERTVVSVVTRGVSDDCNSITVAGESARLRISRLGSAFAFHVAAADDFWHLIRYFALDGDPEVGFLAQSPMGEGCAVHFTEIRHTNGRLAALRDGQ